MLLCKLSYEPRLKDFPGFIAWFLLVAFFAASSLISARGEDEILVGHNAAGKLIVHIEFDLPFGLPVSIFPGLPGYATGEVGFHSTSLDEPTNDFFQLSTSADFRFTLLSEDPGMEILNDHGSGYMNVGETFFVGQAPFDTHPLWNIVSGSVGNSYSLAIKVIDLNSVYAESEPVDLAFTPQPPVLSITQALPGFIKISWDESAPGLVLQSATSLFPPDWTNAESGSTNPITLPVVGDVKYFRLAK
jgi:hypothetical protein